MWFYGGVGQSAITLGNQQPYAGARIKKGQLRTVDLFDLVVGLQLVSKHAISANAW